MLVGGGILGGGGTGGVGGRGGGVVGCITNTQIVKVANSKKRNTIAITKTAVAPISFCQGKNDSVSR